MISVIICSIDREKYSRVVANYSSLLSDEPHEIIGIHDATSLCEGYNRGIRQSKGELLIFSHDDIEILTPDFARRLKAHFREIDLLGVAGTTLVTDGNWLQAGRGYIHGKVAHFRETERRYMICDYGSESRVVTDVQALDGLFFCCRREIAKDIAFDEKTFDGFHLYDLDFTFRAYLGGSRLAICNDIAIVHSSVGSYDSTWDMYRKRFVGKFKNQIADNRRRKRTFSTRLFSNKQELLSYYQPHAGVQELT